MNKICKLFNFIFLFLLISSVIFAKINIFPQPRYIPKLSFYGDSGKAYTVADFKSNLLMVIVWSRTCGPCIAELKSLGVFNDIVQKEGIKVILLSPEDEWKTFDERRLFLKRFNADKIINYLDRKSRFKAGMGVMVTPTTLLINKDGQEVGQITGAVEWDNPKVIKRIIEIKNDFVLD